MLLLAFNVPTLSTDAAILVLAEVEAGAAFGTRAVF